MKDRTLQTFTLVLGGDFGVTLYMCPSKCFSPLMNPLVALPFLPSVPTCWVCAWGDRDHFIRGSFQEKEEEPGDLEDGGGRLKSRERRLGGRELQAPCTKPWLLFGQRIYKWGQNELTGLGIRTSGLCLVRHLVSELPLCGSASHNNVYT